MGAKLPLKRLVVLQKPKILMFGWEFPPHNSGGLGTACLGLTKALTRRKIPVIFVLPKKMPVSDGPLKFVFPEKEEEEMIFRQIVVNSRLSPYLTSSSYRALGEYSDENHFYGPSLIDEVRRYALLGGLIGKRETFDIIYAHDWLSFGAGIEAKKVSGKPLIVQIHATEFDRGGGENVNQEVYEIERRGMEEADAVVAVSQYTKDIVTSRYGIPKEKVFVIHNGIDDEAFEKWDAARSGLLKLKEAGYKLVLFVGRLTVQKGPDYFLRAAEKVLRRHKKTMFIIAGSGDMERALMEEAASLGIGDRLLFAGFLRGKDLFEAYRLADLFVMPSVSEPFGIVPLEAISGGAPVIISKQSGVREVLRHAMTVDFWDVDDMANKILSVLLHAPLQKTMVQNLQKEIQSVTWDAAAEKAEEVIKNTLAHSSKKKKR